MSLASPEECGQLLYQAALYGNMELLSDLLGGEFVHQLDWRDSQGRTALHAAASTGHSDCVQLLLDAGADVNVASGPTGGYKTPLQVAAEAGHTSAVRLLVQAGADLFVQDRSGHCALELAQMAGRMDSACALIDAIEQHHTKVKELRDKLERACIEGELERAQEVLKRTDAQSISVVLHGATDDDYSALYRCSERGFIALVELLLQYGADGRVHPVTFYSPLYISVHAGHTRVVEVLLKSFPELSSVQTFEGWIPLHAACKTGDLMTLRRILFHQYPDYCMQTFSDSSGKWSYRFAFDINAQDVDCRTPLYLACREGHCEAVKLLLDFEVQAVDCSEPNRSTSTSAQEAFEDVMVKDDADLTASTDSQSAGDSPVKKARSKLNVLSSKRASRRNSPRALRPVTVDVYCGKGRTPLQVATAAGHGNIVRLLVERGGANVNLPIAITDEELAELNPADGLLCAGSGALMEACKKGDPELVDLLLEYGAMDHDNRALDVCLGAGREDLAGRLLCRQVFADPEFRVNKKGIEAEAQLGLGRTVVPSALYPAVASMLNWHRASLSDVRETWLLDACLHLNPKMRTLSHNRPLILAAITRVDISKNKLNSLPLTLFQLPSLRILHAGHNKIRDLAVGDNAAAASVTVRSRSMSNWTVSVLEEIHLEHNHLELLPEQLFIWLPNLQALDVSNNKISSLPDSMWTAPKLKDLNLSHNLLTSLPSKAAEAGPSAATRPASVSSAFESNAGDGDDDTSTLSVGSAGAVSAASFEEVRAASSLTEEGDAVVRKSTDDNISVQELQRHNLWQKSVELSKTFEDEEPSTSQSPSVKELPKRKSRSCLTSLNLSHNQLQRVPECLPCVAPFLTRLNLSANSFLEMGPICNYPSKLKHLDLSNNRIMYWFTRPRHVEDLFCHQKMNKDMVSRGLSPSRRRSQSAARGYRSLSVASRAAETGPSASLAQVCPHKRHTRLDNLRTLVLAGNRLDRICIYLSRINSANSTSSLDDEKRSLADSHSPNPESQKGRLVFPCLTMLDASNNQLLSVPASLADLSSLSVLNLSNNPDITSLPPEMGLLTKLWNLSLSGCNLDEPLKTMLESKKYKTMDIIGYLKSVLEDSKLYSRLKLMIVGIQGIGKTSLLEQLRQEGTVSAKKSNEGWAKRMGNKNVGNKTAKGMNISTVGVDVSDWTYEPKKAKNQPVYGPITFRTWDFGGQREYYATHQYFLSRRSLYLVVWRITDGQAGIEDISQWLVNIQARATNSPVIIVGTHFDEVLANSKKFPGSFVDDLQQIIRERFVAVQDADKKGLPKVVDSVIVSSKTRYNIRHLCNMIYSTAFEQRSPGSKERLLEQKIPASYLALEEIVGHLSDQRKMKGKDPVMSGEQYRSLVQQEMSQRYGKQFRDLSELNQATAFLHENGVMLHYEDATLKELYFLDPQWLCDILAHVITIREINPFAKNGLMRLDDLKLLFKSSKFTPTNIRTYILNLLQKFEVALTWDSRNLLIPSLLPDEYLLRGGYPDCEVKVPIKGKGWDLIINSDAGGVPPPAPSYPAKGNSPGYRHSMDEHRPVNQIRQFFSFESFRARTEENGEKGAVPLFTMSKPELSSSVDSEDVYCLHSELLEEATVRRLYIMSYIPSGFWSRLITRLLADEQLPNLLDRYFRLLILMGQPLASRPELRDEKLRKILELESNKPEWIMWQTGVEIRAFGQLLFSLKEFLPLAEIRDVHYSVINYRTKEDGAWRQLKVAGSSILEIYVPAIRLTFRYKSDLNKEKAAFLQMESDIHARTKLMAVVVDIIDTLLEDWYPSLGTRFVHTSEGRLLITRLVPCPRCLAPFKHKAPSEVADDGWSILSFSGEPNCTRTSIGPDTTTTERELDLAALDKCRSVSAYDLSANKVSLQGEKDGFDGVYSFTVEDCILSAHTGDLPDCPSHGLVKLSSVAPDTMFLDVGSAFLISPEQVKRGKMLGRGAFGFVFKAAVRLKSHGNQLMDVALKMLQPVDPGFGARQSAAAAYKAVFAKWQRDPAQYACRAYLTARQELNVLSSLQNPNVVTLIGVLPRPLALVVALAPLGALNSLLQNYKRSGCRLQLSVLQKTLAQVAKALEYLHQEHIIYRDLKSENVLVWRYPPPFSHLTDVDVRLGDYGISRSVFHSGGAKGFGGTEGFMAPEIMRYNGEEEYTEKVDVFSFAMFIYELLTLKLPFEGQEQVKEFMLDGGRPQLTPNELLYPCNVLDLMVVAWSHQPSDRPSASQLVSISTAPEFSHLLDVVSLNDSDAAVLVGETFTVDDTDSPEESTGVTFEGELWLSRSDGQMAVLSCNEHGWLDYKNIYVNEDSFVTAMCLIEDTVWLGELTGIIRVFCAKTYCELYSFPLAPHVLPNDRSPKHAVSLPVAEILSLAALRLVLIVTGQPGALLLCRMIDNLGGQGADPVLASVKVSQRELHCAAALPETNGKMELWVGQSAACITTLTVAGESLDETATVNHYEPPIEGVEVYKLCASANDNSFVWSYVYPGSILYQWNANQKAIVAKLDCSKIAPCSESISTMNIEDKLCPGRCQVTALCLVERDGSSQLYIGTTWGVVIVAEADQLRPVAAFRPHLEDVRVVLPLDSLKLARLFVNQTVKPPSTGSKDSGSSGGFSGRFPTSWAIRLTSDRRKSPTKENKKASEDTGSSYVLTVGKGYRCLIQRFLDNYREEPTVLDSRNKDSFAVMWRTDDWLTS